jgi:dethiobiotin synthetase
MPAIFITGTDTEVGKTVITGLLGRFLLKKGYSVITQKWFQTGTSEERGDFYKHLRLMGMKVEQVEKYLTHAICYSFKFPSSPHLASLLEKKRIKTARIKRSFYSLVRRFNFVIVEGTGGLLVPYSKKNLLIDIVQELNLPIIIVVGNKLGAINHTLLTIEAAKYRGLKIIGVIFNHHTKKGNRVILEDNLKIVKYIGKEKIIGRLPYLKDKESLYKYFEPIAVRVLRNSSRLAYSL